jgi:hypothetical protein
MLQGINRENRYKTSQRAEGSKKKQSKPKRLFFSRQRSKGTREN